MTEAPSAPAPGHADPVPLCVDLDGTLIRSDLLWEGLARFWRQHPANLIRSLDWWLQGRARLKAEIARRTTVPPASLPWVESFLTHLRQQHRAGRNLYLVTASDRNAAQPVAEHLGLFCETLASDGETNLRSRTKAGALVARFGERGFDYAGNSVADLAVWRHARHALVVNAPDWLVRRAARFAPVTATFDCPARRLAPLFRALRPWAWVRNLLVLVPLGFHPHPGPVLAQPGPLLALLAFTLCAAAAYLWDDLMDLETDRRLPISRKRPVAAGLVPLSWAASGAFAGLLAGLIVAATVNAWVFLACTAYVLLAMAKPWVGLDCHRYRLFTGFVSSLLRPLAGHAAGAIPLGPLALAAEAALCLAWSIGSNLYRRFQTEH